MAVGLAKSCTPRKQGAGTRSSKTCVQARPASSRISGSPMRGLRRIRCGPVISGRISALYFCRTSSPQTHKLPFGVMRRPNASWPSARLRKTCLRIRWTITLVTAVTMAVINFFTIWIISFAVEWKFNTLQDRISHTSRLERKLMQMLSQDVSRECNFERKWQRTHGMCISAVHFL